MHLKVISSFKMHEIIYFSRKPEKKVLPVNLGRLRVVLPETHLFFYLA